MAVCFEEKVGGGEWGGGKWLLWEQERLSGKALAILVLM